MIIIEIKCTIHLMGLNHSDTILLVHGKIVFQCLAPKSLGLLVPSGGCSGLWQRIRLAGSSPRQDQILSAQPSTV